MGKASDILVLIDRFSNFFAQANFGADEIEQKIVDILRKLGRMDEAQEIERRLKSVTDVLED